MSDINIGEKMKYFRKQKNISLKTLSEATKLSSSMLSQIERGLANPSINTLKQIAAALDVPLYDFFSESADTKNLIVHPGGRKILVLPASEHVSYEFLTPDLSGTIEYCIMTLGPDTASAEKGMSHNGEEVGYILEGSLIIHFDEETYTLHAGDSLRIPPSTNHYWENKTDKEAKLLFAVTPPSF